MQTTSLYDGGKENEVPPFLKWAGGKRWFINKFPDFFPTKYDAYIEPFLGGGAVFFGLNPAYGVLSDSNSELIHCYQQIKRSPAEVLQALSAHQKMHSDEYYYKVRADRPLSDIEKCARFIYLNRTCWNGLYRVNKEGVFNVPKGTKNAVLISSDDFYAVADRLKSFELLHMDFEPVVDCAGKGDLLFVDPPYTIKHNYNGFIKYNQQLFSWDDQIRLRDALLRAKRRHVHVIATNANHESIRELYERDFELLEVERASVISGKSIFRGKYEELIIRG